MEKIKKNKVVKYVFTPLDLMIMSNEEFRFISKAISLGYFSMIGICGKKIEVEKDIKTGNILIYSEKE